MWLRHHPPCSSEQTTAPSVPGFPAPKTGLPSSPARHLELSGSRQPGPNCKAPCERHQSPEDALSPRSRSKNIERPSVSGLGVWVTHKDLWGWAGRKLLLARTSLGKPHRSAALPRLKPWLSSEQIVKKENSGESDHQFQTTNQEMT